MIISRKHSQKTRRIPNDRMSSVFKKASSVLLPERFKTRSASLAPSAPAPAFARQMSPEKRSIYSLCPKPRVPESFTPSAGLSPLSCRLRLVIAVTAFYYSAKIAIRQVLDCILLETWRTFVVMLRALRLLAPFLYQPHESVLLKRQFCSIYI